MKLTPGEAFGIWESVAREKPLVFQMTNYVVMNEAAHATLAIGASPIMSLHPEEARELAAIAGAVVVNIGTPGTESADAMRLVVDEATRRGAILVLDPVGFGASDLRTALVNELLANGHFTIVKGNAGEISLLGGAGGAVRGVDSSEAGDLATAVREVARVHDCLTAATGEEDLVCLGDEVWQIRSGHEMLTRLTGTGCWLGGIIGACVSASGKLLEGTATALAGFGIAAEKAAAASSGVGSFRVKLFDALGGLDEGDFADIESRLTRVE